MVDQEPMPIEVLVGLVQLVKGGKRGTPGWPTKGGLVLAVGAQRLGGWFTAEDAAEQIGKARGTCARLLSQLDDERVILRDAGVGGEGGRGGGVRYWCEVNPRWEDWRVTWRVPRRIVRQRAVLLREAAQQAPLERFFARSYDARYPRISARLWAREKVEREAAEAVFSRVPWARENGESPRPIRAKSGGLDRFRPPDSRVHGRANFGPAPQEEVPSLGDVDDVLLSGPAAPKRKSAISVQREHIHAAKRAVIARAVAGTGTARPMIFPKSGLEVRLTELVAAHGVDRVVDACRHIDAGEYAPPTFVELVADLLVAGALPDVDEPAEAPLMSRLQLDQRHRNLKQLIATYEAQNLPVPERERADLKRLEDELAKYDDHMSDRAERVPT